MVAILICVAYFAFFSILFGFIAKKRMKTGEDFFVAKGQLGWFAVMCTFVLAPLGGGHTTSLIEQAGMGVGVLWWSILAGGVFVPVFLYWFGPWFRKLKVDTFPQALGKVFGPKIKIVNTSLAPAGWLGIAMSELLGTSTVIYCLSGGNLPYAPYCILLAGLIMVIYILLAGMLQAALMNIINAVVLIVGSFVAVIYVGNHLDGGYASIQAVYEAAGNTAATNLFSFSPSIVFGVAIPVVVLHVLSVASEHAMYQPMLAAKSDKDIRRGAFVGGLFNTVAAFPWVILGVTALAIPSVVEAIAENSRLSVAELCLQMMPSWMIGVTMVALLCALISTGSGMILAVAHVLTDDIIKPLSGKQHTEKYNIWLGRIVVIVVTVMATFGALQVTNIMAMFFWCFSLSMPIFVNYLIGMCWKINRKAAWINLIATTVVNFWWTFACPAWCPDYFTSPFYPVAVVTIGLGIILNLAMPGETGMLKQIKLQKQAEKAAKAASAG
ncbi:MAG: sodium:solute symporter family protein [Oscillospiraceae bacterium]|nr:sodium:solute symporter family protein [Oscillospiraceae bacterium]